MSDLSKYNGNFLEFAENEVNFKDSSNRFVFLDIESIDLTVSCLVGVFPSSDGKTWVEIETDDIDDFAVNKEKSALIIKQKSSGNTGNTIISGNNNVVSIGRGNISMINGKIFVGGVEIDSNSNSSVIKRQSKIKIFAPSEIDLFADLSGISTIASKIAFRKAVVSVAGQSCVGLAAKTVKMSLHGQGNSYLVIKGGDLTMSVSGQGSITTKGKYDSVDASVSGMGRIQTDGIVLDDYTASVSGMGSITHSGEIQGRKRKSMSGMGSISI